jgi:hypothetical protein
VEAEDLFEEVGFGVHGEALDGGVGEAGEADAEFVGFAADFHVLDPLDVGALKGICDAKEGGELGDADAIVGAEGGVAGMVEPGTGMTVVAGDEGYDGDVQAIESEDFGVEDEIFGVFVVGAGADVSADFVEDGGDLEEQGIMRSELVEIGE